jgi:hypothetical protein
MKRSLSAGILVVIAGLTACLPGGPSLPGQGDATPTSAELPTQPPNVQPGPSPIPTRTNQLAASTVLVDQTIDVATVQGGRLELPFNAPEMQPVAVTTTLISGTPVYQIKLADKFGNFLATYRSDPTQAVEAITEVTLPYEGAYKLIIDSLEGEGSISIQVTALGSPTGGGSIELGESLDGLIGAVRTYHTYQFALEEGQSVTVSTNQSEGAEPIDTSIVLYGPDGNYLTDADDVNPPADLNAQINDFIAPMAGTYTAIVTSKDTKTGGYAFTVAVGTEAPEAQGAADIVLDKEYRANFSDKSNLSATFDGTIGEVLKIGVSNVDDTVGIDIYISSPFGQTMAFAVNTGKGGATTINEFQLPYTGRYTLELRPIGDGQASFQLTRLAQPPTGGGILSDQQSKLPAVINQANVFHVYQFEAVAGDKVSLAAFSISKSGSLDLGFALIGPNGHQLLFADDSPSQFPKDPELTNYEIMQSGTYLIVLYSFSTNAVGTYDFVFTRK